MKNYLSTQFAVRTARMAVSLFLGAVLFLACAAPAGAQKKKKNEPPPTDGKPVVPMGDEQQIDYMISEMLGAWQLATSKGCARTMPTTSRSSTASGRRRFSPGRTISPSTSSNTPACNRCAWTGQTRTSSSVATLRGPVINGIFQQWWMDSLPQLAGKPL